MTTTLYIWLFVCIAIIIVGLCASIVSDDWDCFGIALCFGATIGLIVFGGYGFETLPNTINFEKVENFQVTKFPDYVLVSTPEQETLKLTTLQERRVFEEMGYVWRKWGTNHYFEVKSFGLTVSTNE